MPVSREEQEGYTAWAAEFDRGVDRIDAENYAQFFVNRDGTLYKDGPHDGQVAAMESKARIISVQAGWRSGKSVTGPPWMIREMQRMGPGDYAVVTPTYPLLERIVMPVMRHLFQTHLGLGDPKAGSGMKVAAKVFEFSKVGQMRLFGQEGETRIQFLHAADPDSLESGEYKAIWGDEAGQAKFSHSAHETLVSRVSIDQGRILYTSRPYVFDWFKTEIHDKRDYRFWWDGEGKLREDGDPNKNGIHVFCYSSLMNPAFPRDEYFRIKAEMPGHKFRMLYDGLFEKPAGVVYDCFEKKRHVVKAFKAHDDKHKSWARYWFHDFGPINYACVMVMEDPVTGNLFAYKEYHPGVSREVPEHIRELERIAHGIMPISSFGGSWSEDVWRDHFSAEGLPIMRPFVRGVDEQISRVYGAFKRGQLFICDNCVELIDQIEKLSYELDDEGEPIEHKIDDKHAFHLPDALRGGIASILPGTYDSAPNVVHRTDGKPAGNAWRVTRDKVERA